MLANRAEHHRARGHVDTHGERFGREKNFCELAGKQNFDYFFQNGQQASVVHTDTSLEQVLHL
jgi:hypothetical protein